MAGADAWEFPVQQTARERLKEDFISMEIQQLNGHIGARVTGVETGHALADSTLAELQTAVWRHHVLVVPTDGLTPRQLLTLSEQFGTPEDHATSYHQLMEEFPHIVVLDSTSDSRSDTWHGDETFLPRPPILNLLYGHRIPAHGGETAFLSTAAAYDALSDGMQKLLGELTALHDLAMTLDWAWRRGQEHVEAMAQLLLDERRTSHPVVMTHPETGRKWLNVNSTYTRFIENIPPLESEALLGFLYQHMQQPEFTYRHRWQTQDLVIWDQRGSQHYGVLDYDD
ncbi:MAG: TauD/TfdA family dioxygenase [Deltaproteobacteria bacterium]|nr:TauD/TfdA family dioxygenase [Deltaproteobacteria bacterium]